MTPFMTDDFLLDTEFALRLYHDYTKRSTVFSYHCHLPPRGAESTVSKTYDI
jgi:glucuronate isomerase